MAVLLVVLVGIAAVLGYQLPASSSSSSTLSSTVASTIEVLRGADQEAGGADHGAGGARHGALGEGDGAVPDGTTVFDNEIPAVAKLDAGLLGVVRQAAEEAANNGVEFVVNGGWRSPAYQQQLLDEAVSEYGSREEASRWVATPDTSAHVSGNAIDIGPRDAAEWLAEHGAKYGLCRIYGNEPWHFELRPEARDQGCPAVYPDPSHDPRMLMR